MMDNKLLVLRGPVVASGYSGHNEYQPVPRPIFVRPLSDEQRHPSLSRQIFLPFQIVHSTDDQIMNHDLLVVLEASVSGNNLATVVEEVDGEPEDNGRLSVMGDDVACVVVVVTGVDVADDGDIRGDCSMVPVPRGHRNVHHGNNSVRGGKLVVADRSIPIDRAVGDDEVLGALQLLGWHGTKHLDPVVRLDRFGCCSPVTVVVVDDESRDKDAVHGNDANKSLHEHTLPHSSGTSQHCIYHRPIVDFGRTARHYWVYLLHVQLHDGRGVEELRRIDDRSPYQDCMTGCDIRRDMVADS